MSPTPEAPVGVLLAAGAGRRLGRGPKALLSLDGTTDGEPSVARMATALLRGGCDQVIVVAGASAERVCRALDRIPDRGRCTVVVNPDWETGMGSSFRTGIDAAERALAGKGTVVVALVDQPDVGPAVVARLLDAAGGGTGRVTAAGFPEAPGRVVRGHPVVFPLPLAREAAALARGDAAGRAWLRAHPHLVDVVDLGHLASGRDVDTPEDLP